MAKYSPGTPIDLLEMMARASLLQTELAAAQEGLKEAEVEASAGDGSVKVKLGGDLILREIQIDPELFSAGDEELVADMVVIAVNKAMRSAQEVASEVLSRVSGGGALPGL
jgi:DNA-binding YbaB/EbfC family protein